MAARTDCAKPTVGDDPLNRLPVSKQLAGAQAITARLKPGQLIDTVLRLIQTPDQQQAPRHSAELSLGVLHSRLSGNSLRQRRISAKSCPCSTCSSVKRSRKAAGHLRLPGQQGMLHRRANIALAGEPLAGVHMQRAVRRCPQSVAATARPAAQTRPTSPCRIRLPE